jgi:shikimate kinase
MSNLKTQLHIDRPIVLVGLMGAGKTTIGYRLAKKLGLKFRDSDDEISAAAGCSIPDIFEMHGEAIFRDLELRVLDRLVSDTKPYIIATGGGAWMTQGVRDVVAEKAISVWLKADLDVLLERVSRKNNRPLLECGDKRLILQKLIDERYPMYAHADITIESNHGSHESVVGSIIDALEQHTIFGKTPSNTAF